MTGGGGYRPDVEATVEPGVTGSLVGGGGQQLVTLRLEDPGQPATFTHLRPGEARELAYQLLAAAEHAETLTDRRAG